MITVPYTVSQLTGVIRRLIESDPDLADLWVQGEVSNFTRASSGHCYFTLKDAGSQIGGVMWRTMASRTGYVPANGDLVIAHGRVGVYEVGGRYQLYVDEFQPAGLGDLYQQFELLKSRLTAEGLFAPEHKRPLPSRPRVIGVVTSPTGAALRDIVNVLSRRYPLAELLVAPTLVQGDGAPAQIIAALDTLNRRDDVDVIIIARGGGSLEELWAFNDEQVARAIAASRLPVVCGVGHETDYSLADFAADVRAPTPSAAAELVAPDRAELRGTVELMRQACTVALTDELDRLRWHLAEHVRTLRYLSPSGQLIQTRQRVDELGARAQAAARHDLVVRRERLVGLAGRLESFSPFNTLARGYAIVRRRSDGDVVSSVTQVESGDALDVRVVDGEFEVHVP
ncbi:MAG: exodeoxyribonuclease VII large subunit [Chloroflexi bacterium]|nr:exodeoxyribonuclease VII large subunit [Chloroflexota bacterium]